MKKQVLKYAALVIGAVFPTMLYAQLNPKPGFIITNQNDTIYGTIDYLSDKKCAQECLFQANGETAYKTYQPGDISGYRFTDDGVFYVTKTFNIDGAQKTFFAEYLLQGGVSLFRYEEGGVDYYFFIDEQGKVATIRDDGSYSKPATDEYTKKMQSAQRREALGEVSQVFAESDKAIHDLWIKETNSKNLTQITHDYDMEYCTSSGDCVVFRYNEKATRNIAVKLLLKAGIAQGTNKLLGHIDIMGNRYCNNHTMKTTVKEFGVGADFTFPRLNKHLSVEVLALINKWNMSDEYQPYSNTNWKTNISLKYWDLGFQVGPTYSFKPESKFSPILRLGYATDIPLSIDKTNFQYFQFDQEINPAIHCHGFYAGAGVDIAIQKHILRLSAEYRWTHSFNKEVDITRLGFSAEFRF